MFHFKILTNKSNDNGDISKKNAIFQWMEDNTISIDTIRFLFAIEGKYCDFTAVRDRADPAWGDISKNVFGPKTATPIWDLKFDTSEKGELRE
ncbi:hypothetical protein C0J52_07309 [Blattella germanica]|nr:hypothetical protein C0J52_07309 [Blattella germanica]